ncbi:MAG TPA: DUF2934 domain-containing protein [Terracidiphilus sp.]|nr:DUF2934 domain-containing protein [Terracidiphilus sp.]
MEETVAKKPRSTRAKSGAEPRSAAKVNSAATNGTAKAVQPRKPATRKAKVLEMAAPFVVTHDQVAELAFQYWKERGYTHGHHEEDWRRAEEMLRAKAS